MKKLFTLFVIATIALSHSCTESGIENDAMNGNKIKLSATQVEVDFEGETECKITVNSPCSWEAESKNDWLNVVTKQGVAGAKELFFYADNNYDLKKREGTIVVTNRDYGYIDELYVTQKGFEPRIEYPESITFNSEGGTKYATISANFSYSYSENASWITCSRTNDGLKVVATESASTKERSAEITLYNDSYNVEKTIKILQKPFEPTLSVDKTELNFDVKGGSKTIYVTTNAEFNVSESSSWISCTKSGNRVTITVSASDVTKERTAEVEIYLTDYNVTETVKISQKEFVPEFEVKVSELNFEAEGGNKTLSVTANFDYSVSESASWLSYEKTSSGVKITADANADEQERTADVKIYNNTYGKSATVKVTQKKFVPELTIAKTELSFESVGGTQEIAISSNFDYQITSNVDWLTCKKVSNGVSVTASFYDITEDRTAEITISNAKYNQSKSIKVTQKKFVLEFEVGISELTFEAEGGTQTIPVTANFEYSVSESADWLSYQITSSGVKLTVTANVEEKENTAEVKIYSSKYGVTKTVYVKQKKFVPTITIDKTELSFDASGGSQTISIKANFDYTISESASWFTLTKSNDVIKVTMPAYVETVDRMADITISNNKYNLSKTITISQKAFVPKWSISHTSLDFEAVGGVQEIAVSANFEYEYSINSNWVVLTSSKNGINVTVPTYTEEEERIAEIIISNKKYGISKSVVVAQKAFVPQFNIENISSLIFDDNASSKGVSVITNFDYDITISANWVTCKKVTNGVNISVSKYYSTESNRSAEVIIFSEKYNKSKTIAITQNASTHKIGAIVNKNGRRGVIFYMDDTTTKIVSVDETSLVWGPEKAVGAYDANDGAINMERIKTWSDWASKYPAFKWCSNYGSNWYLPAINELEEVYKHKSVINAALLSSGYTSLTLTNIASNDSNYWSSTQYNYSNAYYINFGGNPDYSNDGLEKGCTCKVRAVYAF